MRYPIRILLLLLLASASAPAQSTIKGKVLPTNPAQPLTTITGFHVEILQGGASLHRSADQSLTAGADGTVDYMITVPTLAVGNNVAVVMVFDRDGGTPARLTNMAANRNQTLDVVIPEAPAPCPTFPCEPACCEVIYCDDPCCPCCCKPRKRFRLFSIFRKDCEE